MIKRTHIDHAELLQLGKMLLLIAERQQATSDFACLTKEPRKPLAEVHELATAS